MEWTTNSVAITFITSFTLGNIRYEAPQKCRNWVDMNVKSWLWQSYVAFVCQLVIHLNWITDMLMLRSFCVTYWEFLHLLHLVAFICYHDNMQHIRSQPDGVLSVTLSCIHSAPLASVCHKQVTHFPDYFRLHQMKTQRYPERSKAPLP